MLLNMFYFLDFQILLLFANAITHGLDPIKTNHYFHNTTVSAYNDTVKTIKKYNYRWIILLDKIKIVAFII